MTRRQRLDPAVFHLPVERMRAGYYSDKYFVRTREILLADHHRPRVTMQVFGKTHAFHALILMRYQDETNYGILRVVSNDRRNAWQDRDR